MGARPWASFTRRAAGRCICCAASSAPKNSGRVSASITAHTAIPTPPPKTCAASWKRRPERIWSGSSASGCGAPGRPWWRAAGGTTWPRRRWRSNWRRPRQARRSDFRSKSLGDKVARIEMTGKTQRFEIAAEHEPAAVELDPNVWVLMEVKFAKR